MDCVYLLYFNNEYGIQPCETFAKLDVANEKCKEKNAAIKTTTKNFFAVRALEFTK